MAKITDPVKLLHYFPPYLPDESFVSLVFRYHFLTHNRNTKTSLVELFGREMDPLVDFPTGLRALVRRIPSSLGVTEELLVNRYTPYPYIKPFVSKERNKQILNAMSGETKARVGNKYFANIGDIHGREREPRYCSECISDDLKEFGIPYWHRHHQIPEVLVCTRHFRRLRSTCIKCGPRPWFSFQIHKPGSCAHCGHAYSNNHGDENVDPAQPEAKVSVLISQILASEVESLDLSALRKTYWYQLHEFGLMRAGGINHNALKSELIKRNGMPLLRKYQSTFDMANPRNHWTAIILHVSNQTAKPIHQCLLIEFLFGSFSNFLKAYLKQVEDMQSNSEVKLTNLKNNLRKKYYTNTGRKTSELSNEEILDLLKLLADGIKLKEINQMFSLSKRATDVLLKKYPDVARKRRMTVPMLKKEVHRNELKKALENNPNLTRNKFKARNLRNYDWLEKNDEIWFEKELPKAKKGKHRSDETLYLKKDSIFSEEIKNIANKIINDPEKIRRVSKTRIAVLLNYDGIKSGLSKMLYPKTWAALKEVVETKEQFEIRKKNQNDV